MKQEKQANLLGKKGFYAVLCICLLGVSVLSWSTVNRYGDDTKNQTQSSTVEESTQNVAEVVSNIPYESSSPQKEEPKETQSKTEEQSEVEQTPFFVMPLGGTITKGFNAKTPQYSETYKDWRLHTGIDIKGDKGTAVMSSGFGVVTKIYKDAVWGTVVEISHGGDLLGVYCGLNGQPTVKEGDEVEPGQQIGAIDTIPCEVVEEPHLHFGMKKNDKWVDPMEYIG